MSRLGCERLHEIIQRQDEAIDRAIVLLSRTGYVKRAEKDVVLYRLIVSRNERIREVK